MSIMGRLSRRHTVYIVYKNGEPGIQFPSPSPSLSSLDVCDWNYNLLLYLYICILVQLEDIVAIL